MTHAGSAWHSSSEDLRCTAVVNSQDAHSHEGRLAHLRGGTSSLIVGCYRNRQGRAPVLLHQDRIGHKNKLLVGTYIHVVSLYNTTTNSKKVFWVLLTSGGLAHAAAPVKPSIFREGSRYCRTSVRPPNSLSGFGTPQHVHSSSTWGGSTL